MMVSYAVATAYQQALARLSAAASSAAAATIATSGPALVTAEDMELLRLINSEVSQSAATLAANLCTETLQLNGISAVAEIPTSALTFSGFNGAQLFSSVSRETTAAASSTVSRETIKNALVEFIGRAPQRAARETVISAVEKNPDLRFARVLSGPGACEWCAMLASRGAVYTSKQAAAAGAHTNCKCAILPGLNGDDVSDGKYYKLWRASQQAAGKEYVDDSGEPLKGRALRQAQKEERENAWQNLNL